MRIAICDDDPRELIRLTEILEFYRREKKASFIYQTFTDAMSLLDQVRKNSFDLIFLDVLMPMVNGMQAAHEVRDFDKIVKIIFLTSSTEFAVESYKVKAHSYLLKPSTKDGILPILDELFGERQSPEEGLSIQFQSGRARILFSRLAYVEVLGKKLFFHLTDGSVRVLLSPLSEYEDKLLCRPEFIKVHRSVIVNLWQVQELVHEQILTHEGNSIPVSRRLYPQVREAYMKHLFFRRGVK